MAQIFGPVIIFARCKCFSEAVPFLPDCSGLFPDLSRYSPWSYLISLQPELRDEIMSAVENKELAVWKVMWTVVAYGHTLHHFKSKTSMERLFPRNLIDRYEGVVHEEAILTKKSVTRHTLRHRLLHHSRQSIKASLEKLTQYAMLGAAKRHARGMRGGVWRGIASASASFLRTYIWQRGILDGGPGFLYCHFIALECFFRYVALKYDESLLTPDIKR